MAENEKADPRLEVEFPFNGTVYRARPTWKLITAIERATGEGAISLGFKIGQASCPLGTISIMLALVFAESEPKLQRTPEQIGEILFDEGFNPLLKPLVDLLLRANRGNKEHLKEATRGGSDANPPNGG